MIFPKELAFEHTLDWARYDRVVTAELSGEFLIF